jgi:sugar O-acyltransferase (sialic acid O-acetyltransferase NeuD family)
MEQPVRAGAEFMRERLVIWGAGSTALIVADIIRMRDQYQICGFLDSVNPERAQTEFCGASVLGGEEQLDDLLQQGVNHIICAVSIGRVRLRLMELARSKGFQLATAIHPHTVIASGVPIGAGTIIMAGAVIMPGCRLGENVMISTCASIDHECMIADGAWINLGTHLGGRVIVEQAATVELGTIVAGRIRIGADSLVGAGSLVLHDIPKGVLAYGRPATVIRKLDR